MKKLSLFLSVLCCLALCLSLQQPVLAAPHGDVATLTGFVRDGSGQGYPLYAQISVSGPTTQVVYSDPFTGAYTIPNLDSSQTYTLTVQPVVLGGYQPLTDTLTPVPGQNTRDYNLLINASACSAPGYQRMTVWSNDFEADNGGFGASGQNSSWGWGTPTSGPNAAHSGSKVWATKLNGNYNNDESSYLTRNTALDLSGRQGLRISWWQWLQTYDDFDYVILQISRDNGASWTNVYGSEYSWGTTTKGTVYGNVDLTWTEHALNLDSSYAVPQVKLRLRFKSDWNLFGTTKPGWYVDDFAISDCRPISGGLVAGYSLNANNNAPLNAVAIQHDVPGGASTLSVPTPNDPLVADGFYQLFVSGTSSTNLQASKQHYVTSLFPVTPQAGQVVRRDLPLPPNYDLESSATPAALAAEPGQTVTYTLTLTNTGALPGELLTGLQTIPAAPVWLTEFAPSLTASVLPGQTATVTVQVSIPPFTPAGQTDSVTLNSHWVGSLRWVLPPASRTVTLTTTALNAVPQVQAQSLTTAEETPVDLTLAALDLNGDALTLDYTQPAHGTLSGVLPNLTYTPAPDYNGPDSFTYTASDGSLTSSPAEISILVTPVNDAPTTTGQALTTAEDVPLPLTLIAADVDGDPLTWSVGSPTHGTLSGTAPDLIYTPAPDYNGADSFTFFVNDGVADSNVATVTLTVTAVNDAPTATGQALTTAEDVPLPLTLIAADVEGDPLTWSVGSPMHGTLSGTAPNLTYTPAPDYNGADSFTFFVNDGVADSNVATVTLTVTAVNDAPTATGQVLTTAEDVPLPITLTAADVEGDPLTWSVGSPMHGTLSGTAPNLTYTPAPDYNGADSFTFFVNDGVADSNVATVTLTVTAVNDAPTATGQVLTTAEDVPLPITLTAADVEGDPLTWSVGSPMHGTLSGTAPNLTYTPAPDYNGADSFTFFVNDGAADSNVATVTLIVTAVNDAPTAEADAYVMDEDTILTVSAPGVLANDADVDGDILTAVLQSAPLLGSLTFNEDGSFDYTPPPNFFGQVTFTYSVYDGTVFTAPVTVTITITDVGEYLYLPMIIR